MMRDRWAALVTLARLTVGASPALATVELALVLVMAIAGPLQAYGAALVVDAVTGQSSLVVGGVVLFVALSVTFAGRVASDAARHRLEDAIEFELQHELLELATTPPSIAHHEQPEIANRLGAVREEFRRLRGTAGTIGAGLTVVASSVTTLILLVGIHPLLLVLPMVGVIRLWASAAGARQFRRAVTSTMEHARRIEGLLRIASSPKYGLEVRAYGIRGLVTERIGQLFRLQNDPRWRARRDGGMFEILARCLFGLAFGGAIAFVLWLVMQGRASAGDVAMVLLLAPQADQTAQRLAESVRSLVAMLDVAGHLRFLRAYVAENPEMSGTRQPPRVLRKGIEFRDVSFSYPGTTRPTIRHLSVVLPAGSTVALVGDNGAGKSTVVKLLARLYDYDHGRVLVDGVDLSTLDHKAWRSRISAGFQDFVRYEYTVREGIGLGDPERLRSSQETAADEHVYESAVEAGGARQLIDRLPQGLDTQLGSRFGGIELSGGEWQRLALSRAFVREHPLVVLLDEPAAALDPETEHALLERFNAASAAARATGSITLLVSHRLSTVRMADLILVFDGGELVESGSHGELLDAGGRYAEMFTLQASGYS